MRETQTADEESVGTVHGTFILRALLVFGGLQIIAVLGGALWVFIAARKTRVGEHTRTKNRMSRSE